MELRVRIWLAEEAQWEASINLYPPPGISRSAAPGRNRLCKIYRGSFYFLVTDMRLQFGFSSQLLSLAIARMRRTKKNHAAQTIPISGVVHSKYRGVPGANKPIRNLITKQHPRTLYSRPYEEGRVANLRYVCAPVRGSYSVPNPLILQWGGTGAARAVGRG